MYKNLVFTLLFLILAGLLLYLVFRPWYSGTYSELNSKVEGKTKSEVIKTIGKPESEWKQSEYDGIWLIYPEIPNSHQSGFKGKTAVLINNKGVCEGAVWIPHDDD